MASPLLTGRAFDKCLYQGQPIAVAPPNNATFATATTGGTLAATTANFYQVTAIVNGVETLPSAESSITTGPGSTNSNTVNWSAIPGASGYNVYGRVTGGTKVRIGTTAAGITTFLDTGAAGGGQALPTSTTLTETLATPGLYTPPSAKTAIVLSIVVSNPGSFSGQLFLSRVATSPGTASNRVIGGVTIPPDSASANAPYEWSTRLPLAPGEFLTGYMTYAPMVLTINGQEVQ